MNSDATDRTNDDYLNRVIQLDHFFRGSTLNHSTIIEHSIGRIISYHFLIEKDRRNLFFSLIMNDPSMNYSRKVSIFKDLLKICYPEISQHNKQLFKDLKKIMDWRNQISHCNSLVTEEIKEERDFTKVYYSHYIKDERRIISISAHDFQKRIITMDTVIKKLRKIENDIKEINGIDDDDPKGKVESALMIQVFK